MPSMQVVVECSSPIITYDSRWSSGSSQDNLANQYTASSFTLTQTQGAVSTFLFNGTSVTVVGAKRENHGRYQGQVDGNTASIVVASGASATALFNQTLYNWSGAAGLHTLTFENLDNAFLDIDYIAFTTSIGQDNEPLITDTYQESNPAFTFSPATSWTTPPFTGSFSGGSGVVTSDPNAAAVFKFILTGDGVALHGPVGTGYQVSYTVQIDNGPIALLEAPPTPPNGTTPREVIYMATSLGKGTHTMTVRLAQPPAAGQLLGIDFADVFTTPSIGSSLTSSASTPSGSGATTTSSTNASQQSQASDPDVLKLKIALGVTSAIAGLAIIYVIYSIFAARRRARQAEDKLPSSHPANLPPLNTMGYVRPDGAQRNGVPSTNIMSTNLGSGAGLSYTSESNNLSPTSGYTGHRRGQESFSAGSTSAYGGMASTVSDEPPRTRQDIKRQLVAHNGSSAQVQAPPAYSANGR